MELIATRTMTYATRRLSPGDRFFAPTADARVLVAIQKAKAFVEDSVDHDRKSEHQKTGKSTRSRKQSSNNKEEQHGLLDP
ncbi:hypothetical protein [Brucella intermedia]|uniref:hypothetical protein n=1 Tax=Brucella intermedia TaxID=94625 RepID=UPI00224A7B16|nr:hypothetical protein [Brucella intermedia]